MCRAGRSGHTGKILRWRSWLFSLQVIKSVVHDIKFAWSAH